LKKTLTVAQAVKVWDVSPQTMRRWLNEGTIKGYKIGKGRKWAVTEDPSETLTEKVISIFVRKWDNHWRRLSEVAGKFATAWENDFKSGPSRGYDGRVMTDDECDDIDFRDAEGLLKHLGAGSPREFKKLERWQDLINLKLDPEAIRKLYKAEHQEKFKGQCDICKTWPRLNLREQVRGKSKRIVRSKSKKEVTALSGSTASRSPQT